MSVLDQVTALLKRNKITRRIGSLTYRTLVKVGRLPIVGVIFSGLYKVVSFTPVYFSLIKAFVGPFKSAAAMGYPRHGIGQIVHNLWFGYRFLNPTVTNADGRFDEWIEGYEDEAELKACIVPFQKHTMVSYPGFLSLVNLVKHCEESQIEGALVEMGTWKGGCSGAMAKCSLTYGDGARHVWLFDSYEGLPELRADKDFDGSFEYAMYVADNGTEQTGKLQPIGALEASIEDAEEAMLEIANYDPQKTHIVKGWFQDTLPKNIEEIGPIAVLRLDGDLYDSYMTCLDHLWEQVVDGGFIVIDDWSLGGCRLAVRDFFKKIERPMPYLHHVDFSVKIIQK